MFVRKTSYDTVVSERDRLSVEVARLKAELRIANGEITSLKFRLNDVSFRYDQMLKAGEKKVAQVVENRGVYFEVVPAPRRVKPVEPVGRTGYENGYNVPKTNSRSISRTVRENDLIDAIQQTSDSFAGSTAAVSAKAVVADHSYQSAYSGGCSVDRDSSRESSSCSNYDTPTSTGSNYSE